MPEYDHVFPLVDSELTKKQAHGILERNRIIRPKMYDLGYPNNNCIGCVKGGKGYWCKIRKDFPEVFLARARMERDLGHTCINGAYLDELDPNSGREVRIIVPECGAQCEILDEPDWSGY
jgi:hypothetical protein